MSNIIGFSNATFGKESISMSNQGTDCFLELLEMAAAEIEMTDSQRKLIGFLKERREENLAAPGTASFDIDEMPWSKDTWPEDVVFMMEIIEKAKIEELAGKFDYRPDLGIVSLWLDRFSLMIRKLDKDSLYRTDKISTEIMMVLLLFKNKPQSPTTEQLRKALEKHLGDLEEVPCVDPSGESSGDMFMFPVSKYRAAFEDKPDGIPVIAAFLSSETDSGIDVDDMKRRQFWDVPNGNNIINECKNTILVHTMLGRALPYMQQAEILLAQVGAAIDCFPECIGIYAPQSGKLITPEMFHSLEDVGLSERFVNLFVNARFFNITDTDEMIVDTLGFDVFGGTDVQIHFRNLSPGHVVAYAYNVARYQFENGFPIESGETIDSMDEDGNMQLTPQWTVRYEDSIVEPLRTVLDICVQIDEFDNEDSDNLLGSEWHKYLSDSYESFIENIKTHKKYKPCR